MTRVEDSHTWPEVDELAVRFAIEASADPERAYGYLKGITNGALKEMARRWLISKGRDLRRQGTLEAERAACATAVAAKVRRVRSSAHQLPSDATEAEIERVAAEAERRRAAEAEEREADAGRKLFAAIHGAIEGFASALRLEWTTDLLASEIAMPDGTVTTWGEATVNQHEQRLEMFRQNALANIEGASRHAKAIEALRETGANTLNAAIAEGEVAA